MADLTLLDLSKLNGADRETGLIEEVLTFAPELTVFPARQISGTTYKTVKRTGFPAVGFTGANEGATLVKSTIESQLHECYILRSAIEMDRALSSAYEKGMAELEMIESLGVFKQAAIWVGKQIFYGITNDAKGFPGIKALTPKTGTIAPAVLDAAGTTASTASSVYGVKFGVQNATLIFGNNTTFTLGEFRDQQLTDASGGRYSGRVSELLAWVGLQIGNVNCVGRICNVTADSGKTCTDSLISQWFEKFPVGYRPDVLFMSRRSAGQLQRSRSIALYSGPAQKITTGNFELVSPWPDSAFNVPIVVTDSILNTDALE